jgi:hypothetical protein
MGNSDDMNFGQLACVFAPVALLMGAVRFFAWQRVRTSIGKASKGIAKLGGKKSFWHCQVEANLYDFSGPLDRCQDRKSIS